VQTSLLGDVLEFLNWAAIICKIIYTGHFCVLSAVTVPGYHELEKNKPWFHDKCSKLLDQRKQANLHWLHYPNEINGDNLNNVRREASRYFRNKKRECLKDKNNELVTNSKNKNIRDLYKGINREITW
jgi:hypothetical protein